MRPVEPNGRFLASTTVAAATSAVGLLLFTRWGIGTSPDSAGYLGAARSIATTRGTALVTGDPSGDVALTHFAPLYSILLAFGGLLNLDPYDWARWLNALLFGANLAILSVMLHTALGRTNGFWAVGLVVVFASVPMLTLHLTVLSEPLFLLLTFLGFWSLARHLERRRPADLMVAALALGGAWLTRYAGAAGIMAAAGAILVLGQGRLARRVRDMALFGGLAAVGMAGWLVRNALVADSATGRQLAFHPLDRGHIWQGLHTVSSWLAIPGSSPGWLRLGVCVLCVAVVASALFLTRRQPGVPDGGKTGERRDWLPALVPVLLVYATVYLGFLLVSISLFDANTPLDDRILSPVFVSGTVVGMWSLQTLTSRWPAASGAAAIALIAITGAHVLQGARIAAQSHAAGWGFSSTAWQASPTIAEVRRFPESVLVYSNVPEVVYLQTGRQALPLPRPWLPMNREPNPGYSTEMSSLRRTLAERPSVVVVFTGLRQGLTMEIQADLLAAPSVQERWRHADGVILCVICPG